MRDREKVNFYWQEMQRLGRNQFLLLKMLEYGFWPKGVPTPYQQQKNESDEQFAKRKSAMDTFNKLTNELSTLYGEKQEIEQKLANLREKYEYAWSIEEIRKIIAREIFEESIARREERKKQREVEKKKKSEAWQKKKQEEIVFVGKHYSSMLNKFELNQEILNSHNLPIITSSQELSKLLELEFKELRFLAYHRDVITIDHYVRYEIPKRSGGMRTIAAPKRKLKAAQRAILDQILSKIEVSNHAHGFLKGKSVISGANTHPPQPFLLINMDIKDFFPTITFERVRGMFISFGYSGHISTILAMICTYSTRIPIEIKGKTKYVATSRRILPQGSPASPMITNIICRRLDKRLSGLAKSFGFSYTRYADDMSFSLSNECDINIGRFCGLVNKITKEEGFAINKMKTRFLRSSNQQNITGIVINNAEIGIPRKWIRRYRAAIHNATKLKERSKGDLSDEVKYEISGMTSWVKSVNPKRYNNLITKAANIIKN